REGIQTFLNHLEVVRNASSHTIRNYLIDLKAFENYLKEKKLINSITKREIRGYLAHLNLRGVSKRTLARHLSALRSLFKFLMKEKRIEENPLEEIESPKLDKPIPKAISYEE